MNPKARQLVTVGLAGVATAFGIFLLILVLAGQGDVEVNLGDERFGPLDAERLAAEIAERGPVAFPDASPNQALDIYLQHLGDDPTVGWLAFSAHAPGSARECLLAWDEDSTVFVDPCSTDRFPADGTGLAQYPVTVDGGAVFVDFRL